MKTHETAHANLMSTAGWVETESRMTIAISTLAHLLKVKKFHIVLKVEC